jgi:uncharacterized protein (DUF1330 family)
MIVFNRPWMRQIHRTLKRNTPMTAYALVTIHLEDRETFARYRTLAGPAMQKHQAKPLSVSSEAQIIEGDGPAPDVTVILEFPDRDHALAWINDKDIAEVHATRRASGRSQIILM